MEELEKKAAEAREKAAFKTPRMMADTLRKMLTDVVVDHIEPLFKHDVIKEEDINVLLLVNYKGKEAVQLLHPTGNINERFKKIYDETNKDKGANNG